uniref:Putative BAHD family acyltransferase n=1 Tax=Pseudozyma flocculosa TaxID=84751 RepID=E2JKE4_9BASI|nr:putative BAHD family acyltransferase [Pseudozyma flocculosa]
MSSAASASSPPAPRVPARNLKIKVQQKLCVLPAPASPAPAITLTGQDLSMAKIYMHMHYIFSPSSSPYGLSELANDIENALSLTLDEFPYIAGSIDRVDDKWILQDSRKGVELQIAQAEEEAGGLSPQEIGGSWDQDVGTRAPFVGEDEALVAIRVTRVISITTSVHHWLMDFASYFDFLSTFASRLTSPAAAATLQEQKPKRNFERDVFSLLSSPGGEEADSAPAATTTTEEDDAEVRSWFRASAAPPCFKRPVNHTYVVPVLFTASKLGELKAHLVQAASASGTTTPTFSTMDALHALLWSSITRSRDLAAPASTKLLVTMDGRRRVANGELAAEYFGNVHPGFAFRLDVASQDLSSAESLAATAQKLRSEYLANIGPQTMERIIRYQQRNLDRVSTNIDAMFANDVVISNLSGYEYGRVSFGRLGRPRAVTMLGSRGVEYGPFKIDAADGTVTVLAVPEQQQKAPDGEEREGSGAKRSDVIAYIGLRQEEMARLLADKEIAKWGEVLY